MKRHSRQNFCTIKNFSHTIERIERNDPTLSRVNFLALTFLQLRALHEAMEKNTHIRSIDIPPFGNPEMYGDHRVCEVAKISQKILDIVARNIYTEKKRLRMEPQY